ncbi:MAG: glycosyltransferase family 4 protein [Planctomycetes bacterium]|nr:glycosyltransferase family 4 protein [Planctomycetota bacterium]MCB9872155.1 glycosyltransferase family 4 protein [Planctomycetota bacterium]
MRLLYVVHQFLPRHLTGTEQYVRSLALGMRARGHEVSVFTLEPVLNLDSPGRMWIERDEEVDGVPVRRAGLHLETQPNRELADYLNPLAVRLLCRFLDEHEFDLAHVFHLRYLGIGALAELRRRGLPVVVNLMDFWFLCPTFILLRADGGLCDGPPRDGVGCVRCAAPDIARVMDTVQLDDVLHRLAPDAPAPPDLHQSPMRRARALIGRKERLFEALAGASAVVAPSRFLQSVFEANGFPRGLIEHVPYGVDPDRLGGRTKRWSSRLRRRVEIGFIGSLTEHKGLHLLIEALRSIDGNTWHLHVHGSLETHPAYSKRLRALADEDPRITFHGPFPPRRLGGVLAELDLIVVPSVWYENTPFTVLEAQMMGLPVLASDLGGISESVRHQENGFLFEAGSVPALRAQLEEILADPECLPRLRLDAGVRTLDQNLDDFAALYARFLPAMSAAPADAEESPAATDDPPAGAE